MCDKNIKPTIIALCGFEGSGKNVVADKLTNENYKSISFAHSLKHAVAHIFGWEFHMLEGITAESREWREKVDEFWASELGIPGLTPRKVLQLIGTDVMRNHFSDRIWILSAKRQILNSSCNVVITDCRFPSEAIAIKEWGGLIIKINRDAAKPIWLDDFYALTSSIDRTQYATNEEYCTTCAERFYAQSGVHPAETSLLMYDKFDHIMDNNGTLDELSNNINKLLFKINSNTINIAFDFDDVIVPFMPYFVKFCNRKYGYKLEYSDCYTLNIMELLKLDESAARDVFNDFAQSEEHDDMHLVVPSEESVNTLKQLSNSYGLFIVTAREHRFEDITMKYLNKYLPNIFKGVYLANYHGEGIKYTKQYLCEKHNCQVLIDDSVTNIDDLKESNIKGILFGDYPWNNNCNKLKANSWIDLFKLFC